MKGRNVYEREVWPDPAALYRAQRDVITDLVIAAGDGVDTVPVPACPAWTVADLTAHLAGSPAALLSRSYPGDDAEGWVAGHVAARAGRTARENLAEWADVGPAYDALLTKNEVAWGALLYDAIAHEHDLRDALGRPGGRDSAGIEYALDRALGQLQAKAADSGAGTLQISDGSRQWAVGDGDVVATMTVDGAWEAVRLLGSRRSEAQVRAAFTAGDPTPWLALLPWGTPSGDSTG